MDQAIRNKLRSVVTQCRKLLEDSIAQQLQGRYDIYATGKKDEVKAEEDVPLGHLTEEERQARQDVLAHFEHVKALGYKPRESLEQLVREIAFTHLNRLCAYKMMEVRDVYVGGQKFREAVSKGLKSQGFLFYLADHPVDEQRYKAGQQEEAYRHFLNWLGGTLSEEIGVLFSPTDPANRVYPPQRVLDDVLDLLNSEELKGIWSEDETIGWVYQYFTPKELRDQGVQSRQCQRFCGNPGPFSARTPLSSSFTKRCYVNIFDEPAAKPHSACPLAVQDPLASHKASGPSDHLRLWDNQGHPPEDQRDQGE